VQGALETFCAAGEGKDVHAAVMGENFTLLVRGRLSLSLLLEEECAEKLYFWKTSLKLREFMNNSFTPSAGPSAMFSAYFKLKTALQQALHNII
jgi:hypothetical protein